MFDMLKGKNDSTESHKYHEDLLSSVNLSAHASNIFEAHSLCRRDLILLDEDERVGRFSGGMKRRLSVAISTLSNPSLLFIDE